MRFIMNNNNWEIREKTNEEMMALTGDYENFTHGTTEYSELVININKSAPDKRRTLCHELMHCFMYEYGHNQFENKTFNNEDICEMVASSHDIINRIINKYFEGN